MCIQASSTLQVPEETIRVARAIYPDGNLAMDIRDELYCVYNDETFRRLYADQGRPAESAWRLALVSVLQYAENLSDRQAAEAVRDRVSWKYLLGLELTDRGFDASVLSEFRRRLIEERAEYRLLNTLLSWLQQVGLLKSRGRMRTDATHVLGHLRTLNRLTLVGETLRYVLNELAAVAPDWLRNQVNATWYERYGRRVEDYRLPSAATAREALAQSIGEDGLYLLSRLAQADAPTAGRELPAIETLRQVWAQQYDLSQGGSIRWRLTQELPPAAELIQSPYELEARFARKNETTAWVGYKVHLTECCDEDAPRLITHVYTTPATTPDEQALDPSHAALQAERLLPSQHLVDEGYIDSIQ
jgi:transposase